MRTEITERRATINTLSHETKDVVQDDDESGTMDWFTKVFVSLKVGTESPLGSLGGKTDSRRQKNFVSPTHNLRDLLI